MSITAAITAKLAAKGIIAIIMMKQKRTNIIAAITMSMKKQGICTNMNITAAMRTKTQKLL